MAGHDTASHSHDTVGSKLERAWPDWGIVSRYNKLYRDQRELGCWVVSRCSTQQRCDMTHGAAIRAAQHAQGRTRHSRVTVERGPATRPPMTATRLRRGHDTAEPSLRHGQARPATQRCARGQGAVCAVIGLFVHAAARPVRRSHIDIFLRPSLPRHTFPSY